MKKILCIAFSFSMTASFGQGLTGDANMFLNSLNEEQKVSASYSLDDKERFNWHFVPRERNGACFRTFSEPQKNAALSLIKTSLSDEGVRKVTSIMTLENVLRLIEGRTSSDTYRDPLNYYITIFGTPSTTSPWAWRLEGHHVAMNFTITNNEIISATPTFFGSNPAVVPNGTEKGKQILKLETDLGFQLFSSLTLEQKTKAMFSDKGLPDILSFNKRKAVPLDPRGLSYSDMSPEQQKIFLQLLNVYVKNYSLGFSSTLMRKIEQAGIKALSFAWAGGLTGSGNYYRIQGPMLLIEYDNTQNNANHVHTVVRDLTNDFAEDILREHYQHQH